MTNEQAQMLKTIQALEFTCLELNLYLDTHPDDQRALADFNTTAGQLAVAKRNYEMVFGPLTNYGHSLSGGGWRWIDDPWPWEMSM